LFVSAIISPPQVLNVLCCVAVLQRCARADGLYSSVNGGCLLAIRQVVPGWSANIARCAKIGGHSFYTALERLRKRPAMAEFSCRCSDRGRTVCLQRGAGWGGARRALQLIARQGFRAVGGHRFGEMLERK